MFIVTDMDLCGNCDVLLVKYIEQEDKLMPTNPHDASRGQSRSPSTVQFSMLDMVLLMFYSNFSPRLFFEIFDSDLETRVRGHSRS